MSACQHGVVYIIMPKKQLQSSAEEVVELGGCLSRWSPVSLQAPLWAFGSLYSSRSLLSFCTVTANLGAIEVVHFNKLRLMF